MTRSFSSQPQEPSRFQPAPSLLQKRPFVVNSPDSDDPQTAPPVQTRRISGNVFDHLSTTRHQNLQRQMQENAEPEAVLDPASQTTPPVQAKRISGNVFDHLPATRHQNLQRRTQESQEAELEVGNPATQTAPPVQAKRISGNVFDHLSTTRDQFSSQDREPQTAPPVQAKPISGNIFRHLSTTRDQFSQPVQAKLSVGALNDQYEQEDGQEKVQAKPTATIIPLAQPQSLSKAEELEESALRRKSLQQQLAPSGEYISLGSTQQTQQNKTDFAAGKTPLPENSLAQQPPQLSVGTSSHNLIAGYYEQRHSGNSIFKNVYSIKTILQSFQFDKVVPVDYDQVTRSEIENSYPDILDLDLGYLYEIKPYNARGIGEGYRQVTTYLDIFTRALGNNRVILGEQTDRGSYGMITVAENVQLAFHAYSPGLIVYRYVDTSSQQRLSLESVAQILSPIAGAALSVAGAIWFLITSPLLREAPGY